MKIFILAFAVLLAASTSLDLPVSHPGPATPTTAPIAFKSTDGGKTWQDISKGLPADLENIRTNSFFSNDKGLYVRLGDGLYRSAPNAKAPFWTKEVAAMGGCLTAPLKSENFYWGVNLKNAAGKSIWSPVFENFHEPRIRSAFETSRGAIFLGIDRGLYKSTDDGKNWKHVVDERLVGHLAESNGVLLAISMRRIIRSTDEGESWTVVMSDSSVAFDVKPIEGGFAAITADSEPGTRKLRLSYDGGKSWQATVAGVKDNNLISRIWRTWNDRPRVEAYQTSITRVGDKFYCTHPDGIFGSTDQGKAWKLLLPSVVERGFSLFVSGQVIYAIPSRGDGC